MYLASTQFLGRQYLNNATQLFSAGGNILHYVEDTIRLTYATVTGKKFYDVLDNTKAVYNVDGKMLTEKGLFQALLGAGYINDYTQAIVESSGKVYVPNDSLLRQVKRTARQMKATWEMYPDWFKKVSRLSETGFDYVDELVNGRMGSPFRWGNVQFETLGKFSLAKTVFKKEKTMFLNGGVEPFLVKNMNDFTEYSSRYFYWYDTTALGKLGDAAGYVLPFLNYRMKNLNGTFRQLINSPSKFGNYLELYAALNEPMSKEDLPIGGVPDYVWGQLPVIFKMDKETTGLKQDTYFYFPTASLIQQFGALSDLGTVKDLLGASSNLPLDQNPAKQRSNIIQKLLDDESWGWLKLMKAVSTGVDPDTGDPIDDWASKDVSFLGMRTSRWTKYALAAVFPPLDRLDKWNPERVFGQQAYYDPYKQEFVEGKPSFAGVERNRRSGDDQPVRFTTPLSELFGIKASFIDVAYNMGATHADIKQVYYENRQLLKRLQSNIRQATTPESKAAYEAQFYLLRDYTVALKIEYTKVDNWMKLNGFPPKRGLTYLKEQGIKAQDLPDISQEEKDRIQQEVYNDNDMGWQAEQ
jgi:hypothetical protein